MRIRFVAVAVLVVLVSGCAQVSEPDRNGLLLETDMSRLRVFEDPFRFQFEHPDGNARIPAHPSSGLLIGSGPDLLRQVSSVKVNEKTERKLKLSVSAAGGTGASVTIRLHPHRASMSVRPRSEGSHTIVARTAGLSPAFGLADHAGWRESTDVTGFTSNDFRNAKGKGVQRLISNFVIFPKHRFAAVNVDPGRKIVWVTEREQAQGSVGVERGETVDLHYLIGSPHQIYAGLKEVRERTGYPLYKPKYQFFGVGWEAYGALGYNTNRKTVTRNINRYLDLGFPLEWMVIGSGFWPHHDITFQPEDGEPRPIEAEKLKATTSFGLWDEKRYPSPEEMLKNFHEKGLKVMLGLRIAFIPGGPYTPEGVENGYFLKNLEGDPKRFNIGFPETEVYLLNAQDPKAVEWYVGLCEKWLEDGIDGFKEDIFQFPKQLRDDKVDPVNQALMEKDVYIMGRNMYFGSPADIHRINDFNFDQDQDRGPINGLAFAYSGFPFVYPDIVGGTGLYSDRFEAGSDETKETYLMRYAMYAAVNPAMSFGYGPWHFGDRVVNVTRKAARLHDRLQPYIYSNAIRTYRTGFPYTMTPLPLVHPDDSNVYELGNSDRRAFEWMIGDSLLATPLYGADYPATDSRDLYLPSGKWIHYETGEAFEGPRTLKDFPLPIGQVPLFVGGKGIVVEERGDQLQARVYPIRKRTSMAFHHKSGASSKIEVDVDSWKEGKLNVVTGDERQEIPTERDGKAVTFELVPGTNYHVQSGP